MPDANPHHGRPPEAETRRLAAFVAELRLDALPGDVVARTGQVVADALACGVGGFTLAPEIVGPLRRYALGLGGEPQATLLGGGERVAQPVAALANAATVHTIDYDDTHMPSIGHYGASVVAAALAAVERSGGTGEDLVAAVVAGFEAGGKVGRSVLPGHYQRWHSTSSLGGIAAAAAAARGLRLDAEATDMALGFAADDAGGTRYCIKVGDFSKSLHAGTAAWKGSQGALLAAAGAAGPTGLLEHPVGFYWAYSDEREPGRLGPELDHLGRRWEILEDDIKAHPCILAAHCAIEATIDLVGAHDLGPDDIAAIRLVQPYFSDNHGLNYEPDSAMAARLSVPYCVAVAATDRRVGLAQFEGERWHDPALRALMRRVTSTPDRSLNERHPASTAALVDLETVDGRTLHREVVYPRGSHRRPLSAAEHAAKLEELLARTLDDDAVAAALEAAGQLGELPSLEPLITHLTVKERVS